MVAKTLISVYGLLKNVEFHQSSGIIEDICRQKRDEFQQPVCKGMLEYEWVAFMKAKTKDIGGEMWSFTAVVIVFEDNTLIGDFEKFLEWTKKNHQYTDFRPLPLWHAMAKEKYKAQLLESQHDFVYMDIEVSSEPVGRLLIELYSDKCPKTCRNFLELSQGAIPVTEKCNSTSDKDFVTQKGTGGYSIYGPLFEDENFSVLHDKRGVVGMANKGRHTNASQFYITLQPTPWMDTKYVAFGQVIEGMSVLKILEEQETNNERPKKACVVADCGLFDVEKLYT